MTRLPTFPAPQALGTAYGRCVQSRRHGRREDCNQSDPDERREHGTDHLHDLPERHRVCAAAVAAQKCVRRPFHGRHDEIHRPREIPMRHGDEKHHEQDVHDRPDRRSPAQHRLGAANSGERVAPLRFDAVPAAYAGNRAASAGIAQRRNRPERHDSVAGGHRSLEESSIVTFFVALADVRRTLVHRNDPQKPLPFCIGNPHASDSKK
jgi:hypothetical protein